jgi:hypothetical protein
MLEAAVLAGTFISANLHGVTSHSRVKFTLTAVRISELTLKLPSTLFVVEVLDESGFEARQRREIFFLPLHFKTSRSAVWGQQSLLLSGHRGSFV